MGRHATVLSIPGGENDGTGLPEPLELFLYPKTGKRKKMWAPLAPLGPLLGAALKGMLHQWVSNPLNLNFWCAIIGSKVLWLTGRPL